MKIFFFSATHEGCYTRVVRAETEAEALKSLTEFNGNDPLHIPYNLDGFVEEDGSAGVLAEYSIVRRQFKVMTQQAAHPAPDGHRKYVQ